MITPQAVVGDVHADLAFAGGLDEHAVHVDACQFEERGRLPSPKAWANFVEDIDERVDVGGAEAAAEIARGGRIGNAASAQRVEVDLVLATQFDVLQAS